MNLLCFFNFCHMFNENAFYSNTNVSKKKMQELNLNLDNILKKDKQLSFKTFFLTYHLKKDTY